MKMQKIPKGFKKYTVEDIKHLTEHGFGKPIYGVKFFTSRREAKPIGKLIINGEELTIEKTSNYLKANDADKNNSPK